MPQMFRMLALAAVAVGCCGAAGETSLPAHLVDAWNMEVSPDTRVEDEAAEAMMTLRDQVDALCTEERGVGCGYEKGFRALCPNPDHSNLILCCGAQDPGVRCVPASTESFCCYTP